MSELTFGGEDNEKCERCGKPLYLHDTEPECFGLKYICPFDWHNKWHILVRVVLPLGVAALGVYFLLNEILKELLH